MLTKCVNCGFYLQQADEYCLNCGIKNPHEALKKRKKGRSPWKSFFRSNVFLLGFSMFLALIAIAVLIDVAVGRFPILNDYVGFFAYLLWIVLLFGLLFILIRRRAAKSLPHVVKYKNNLNSKLKIIEKRTIELSGRGQKIDAILDKIRETDGANLQEVRRKLLAAREIVMSQFARYELQKQKIELVRLQNELSPYLFGLHRLDEFETESGLSTIEGAQLEIGRIRGDLTRHDAIDFPPKARPEKENFLAQLAETGDSCQKLREALLSRQAARALQDISPIEENLRLPNSRHMTREAEVFNIQTTLTDFSESFDELEREYRRLRAEEKTERQLLAE